MDLILLDCIELGDGWEEWLGEVLGNWDWWGWGWEYKKCVMCEGKFRGFWRG